MKTLIFLIFVCLFCSCMNSNERLKQKLLPILNNEILTLGVSKIDSIKIYKIDTISDSLYYQLRSNRLYHSLKYYMDKRGYYFSRQKDLDYQAEEAYNAAHMELYTPDQTEFRREQMDVYKQRSDEADDYKNEVQKYSDTLALFLNEVKRVENIMKTKKLKKDNLLGYFVSCNVLGVDKDNSEMKLDSLGFCISPTFRIMHLEKL